MFSCEFCNTFKNTFSTEHIRTAAIYFCRAPLFQFRIEQEKVCTPLSLNTYGRLQFIFVELYYFSLVQNNRKFILCLFLVHLTIQNAEKG